MRTSISRASRNRTFPSHTTGNIQLNLTKDMVDSSVVTTIFFVERSSQKTIQPQCLHQVPIITATYPDTLQSIAHTKAASSQQWAQRQQPVQLTQVKPPSNNVVTNEVEYFNCSDYVFKAMCLGNLRKHLQFWKKYFVCTPRYR